jgi:hypothetical protein
MRRSIVVVLVGILGIALLCLGASETLTNHTGKAASGVTIQFSQSVRISNYDESVFPDQDPSSRSGEFTFSGGKLANGGRFSVTWTPSSARITDTEWIPLSSASSGSSTDNMTAALTYDQIMAQIAHYPGPDEPLYEPDPDEQIWLTDLDGHADIYDNDSVRINYAPGFDKSQITKVEVYRNGIKMRFLPDKLDVLTNDQMKTFDGNPQEYTPASSHTDHAIMGYDYRFQISVTGLPSRVVCEVVVKSGIRYSPGFSYAHLIGWWDDFAAMRGGEFSRKDAADVLEEIKDLGILGASIDVEYFMDSLSANGLYSLSKSAFPSTPPNAWTPTASDLREILQMIKGAGLDAFIRMQVWVKGSYAERSGGPSRSCIRPRDISAFFNNYTATAVNMARIADEEETDCFCPLTEMDSLSPYDDETREMLTALSKVFSGQLGIEQSTELYLLGKSWACDDRVQPFSELVGTFWDWTDDVGAPLRIEMSCWDMRYSDTSDPSLSSCVESFVSFWEPAIGFFRQTYPADPLVFGEMGVRNVDGAALGFEWFEDASHPRVIDDQEFADLWATYLIGCAALEVDGLDIWCFGLAPEHELIYRHDPYSSIINGSPAERIIRAIMGSG